MGGQMICFAYHMALGGQGTALNPMVGLTMKPRIWESDRTALDLAQPVNRAYTREHLNS